jgi:hypothetical protein
MWHPRLEDRCKLELFSPGKPISLPTRCHRSAVIFDILMNNFQGRRGAVGRLSISISIFG